MAFIQSTPITSNTVVNQYASSHHVRTAPCRTGSDARLLKQSLWIEIYIRVLSNLIAVIRRVLTATLVHLAHLATQVGRYVLISHISRTEVALLWGMASGMRAWYQREVDVIPFCADDSTMLRSGSTKPDVRLLV